MYDEKALSILNFQVKHYLRAHFLVHSYLIHGSDAVETNSTVNKLSLFILIYVSDHEC